MSYPFRHAFHDLGLARGPRLGFVVHMAEGGGTVGFLERPNRDGVSVHYVVERSGRVVQMLLETHMHSSIRTSAIRTTDDADGFYGRSSAVAVLGEWADTRRTLGPNHASIAVEIEGFAAEGPNDAQAIALVQLVAGIRERHPGIGNLGHRDFADYKACPGRKIDWTSLGGHGRQEESMPVIVTEILPGATVTLTPQDGLYDAPAGGFIREAEVSQVVPALFRTRDDAGASWIAIALPSEPNPPARLVYVIRSDVDVTRPVPVVDCDDVVTRELEAAADRAAAAVRTR